MNERYIRGMLACALFLCSFLFPAAVQAASEEISQGVFLGTLDVGGMTKKEAKAAEKAYLEQLAATEVTVLVGKHKVTTTLSELGYQCDQTYAEKAVNFGKEGNLIERYMKITAAKEESFVYEYSFSLDQGCLEAFVKEQCGAYYVPAKNARLHQKKNGNVRVTAAKSGIKIVEDETAEKIKRTVLEDWDKQSVLEIAAILVEELPTFGTDTAKECTELLGTYTTTYASVDKNHRKNIKNVVKLLDGSVLLSGEEFSVYKALYPITEEHGFAKTVSFVGGKAVRSVGGGISQAATTLYNAVLLAELEVTQRNAHTIAVSYADLGMDAAIAGSYKDLKFCNNLNAPVYIEAVTKKNTVTFRIFGREARPENHTIYYKTKIIKTIEPEKDVVISYPHMLKGTGMVLRQPQKGYQVEVYKIIKTKGTGDRKKLISYSEYAAVPRYVIAGSADP